MSRLINADKLIEYIWKKHKEAEIYSENTEEVKDICCDIVSFIDEQPTAYDVDKVISKIWDRSELIHIKHEHNDEVEDYIRVTDATEIVREGGIDD